MLSDLFINLFFNIPEAVEQLFIDAVRFLVQVRHFEFGFDIGVLGTKQLNFTLTYLMQCVS